MVDGRAVHRVDGSPRHQSFEQAITRDSLVGQQTGSRMQSDLNIQGWDAAALSTMQVLPPSLPCCMQLGF